MGIENKNFFMVYRKLFEIFDGNFTAACFASYIMNAYQVLRDKKYINGVEYRMLTDSFINGYFDMSSPTIRNYLKMMEEKGLISIEHHTSNKRSWRYVRLLVEIVDENGVETIVENDVENGVENSFHESIPSIPSITSISYEGTPASDALGSEPSSPILTKEDTDAKASGNIYTSEANSDKLGKATSSASVHLAIRSNIENDSLSEEVLRWYDYVGNKKKLCWNQIADSLDKLKADCKGDIAKMIEQVNNSYRNGYLTFYPPREEKKYKKKTSDSVSRRYNEPANNNGFTFDW